jgi:hypothetical protein
VRLRNARVVIRMHPVKHTDTGRQACRTTRLMTASCSRPNVVVASRPEYQAMKLSWSERALAGHRGDHTRCVARAGGEDWVARCPTPAKLATTQYMNTMPDSYINLSSLYCCGDSLS